MAGCFHTRVCLLKTRTQLAMNHSTTKARQEMIFEPNTIIVIDTVSWDELGRNVCVSIGS